MTSRRRSLRNWLLVPFLTLVGAVPGGPQTAPSSIVVTGLPGSVGAGGSVSFTVTVLDGGGGVATGYAGTVHFGSNFPATTMPADYTYGPGDTGSHQFSITPREAGTQIVDVSDAGAGLYGSGSTRVEPGPAGRYAISNLTHGVDLSAGVPALFDVTAYDAYNNMATGYGGSAAITSSAPTALVPGPVVFRGGAVTGVSITFGRAGAQSVTATDTVAPSITDTAWALVDAAPMSAISVPSSVTTGTGGWTASVPSQTAVSYAWSIVNGTITGGDGTSAVTFSAGAVGTLKLRCQVTRASDGSTSAGTADVNVVPLPVTPTITAASPVSGGATGRTASVVPRSGMTYAWTISGGAITSPGGSLGVTGGGLNTITYTAGRAGTITLTCVERNAAGTTSSPGTASVSIIATPASIVVTGLPTSVVAGGSASFTVTVLDGSGGVATGYAGTVHFGSNFPATTVPADYTYGPGDAGSHQFSITTRAAGTQIVDVSDAAAGLYGSASTMVDPAAAARYAISNLTHGVNLSAGVPARFDLTAYDAYNNVATGYGGSAAITSSDPTATLPGPVPFTAGAVMGVSIMFGRAGAQSVTATDTVAPSITDTAWALLDPAPASAISAPSSVTTATGGWTASVPSQTGVSYAWSLVNGTITSGEGTSAVTFDAGAVGTLTLRCQVTRASDGSTSTGSADVNVLAAGSPAPTAGAGHLYFVAHQDDDLLFMNPDVGNSIRAGVRVRTIYLTAAGSDDGTAAWQARENGILNAYAAMANVAKDWSCAARTYLADKSVSVCTLNTHPLVSVAFMRLRDGSLASLWARDDGAPFYQTPVASLTTADEASTYSRAELIQAVAALVADFAPDRMGTLDSSLAYGDDHPDHVASALFALEADHLYSHPHQLRIYRGYSVYGPWYDTPSPEAQNLSAAQYAEKVRIMESYGGAFPVDSDFDHWCWRHYAVSRLSGGTGRLAGPDGQCVEAGAVDAHGDTPAVAAPCSGPTTRWTVTAGGAIQGPGGNCLAVGADGLSVVVSACVESPAQSWTLISNGQVRGIGATCLGLAPDGVALQAALCEVDASAQKWTPADSQRWVQRLGDPSAWSSGSQFSDADLGSPAAYAGSFRLGDVNGDGYADACIRLAGGVFCALNTASGAFAPYRLYSAAFSDAMGWLPDAHGATLQLGDVDGDGKADVCGRSADGIVCATATADGAGLGDLRLWSSGRDFSDADGWAASAAYYGSIHLADVNGDGYADVCGRSALGVVCALNDKAGRFAPAGLWIGSEFTDALGWPDDRYGSTLQFGDLNGDGKADVCGRGPAGVRCATANPSGSAFTDPHQWSLRSDFSDAGGWWTATGYFGSIRLADVNGDGYADLCGRGRNGIVCAISDGVAFDGVLAVMPSGYTDALGWRPGQYGATIQFADLDRDGRADVCGRGPGGLVCSKAP